MTARLETFETIRGGVFAWRLVGGNGEKMAGGEGYPSRSNAERGARDLVRAVTELVLEAGDEELVEVYEA